MYNFGKMNVQFEFFQGFGSYSDGEYKPLASTTTSADLVLPETEINGSKDLAAFLANALVKALDENVEELARYSEEFMDDMDYFIDCLNMDGFKNITIHAKTIVATGHYIAFKGSINGGLFGVRMTPVISANGVIENIISSYKD